MENQWSMWSMHGQWSMGSMGSDSIDFYSFLILKICSGGDCRVCGVCGDSERDGVCTSSIRQFVSTLSFFVMRPETRRSQAKLAMRAETHKLQHRIIRLPVNQHQVWFDMAVTVVIPLATECVIPVLLGQNIINGVRLD